MPSQEASDIGILEGQTPLLRDLPGRKTNRNALESKRRELNWKTI